MVVGAVVRELLGSGRLIGYQRLRTDYGLVANRATLRNILKKLDPEGVERRSKHKLKRRKYQSKGPKTIWQTWHIDVYDKLKPFGFCIHGAIDGYSRRIYGLKWAPQTKKPRIVGNYFIDCVQVRGIPCEYVVVMPVQKM